jgi:CarD family transcriptional regulator
MAQKTTSGRHGAKKAAVKKPVARAASVAKGRAPPSKAHQSKRPTKPTTTPKVDRKTATAAKHPAVKPQAAPKAAAKPLSTAGKPSSPSGKIMLPKAVAIKQALVAAAARPGAAVAARTMPAAAAKLAGQKIIAPTPTKLMAGTPPVAPAQAANKKPVHQRHGFKTSEWIVYPAHGVGRIVAIEEQEIAGISLELFVITFEKDKLTLRVPTGKSQSVGMRKLAEEGTVKRAMETLKGRARVKRTMWSRRAQEYEAKINSGDLIAIAEVVRDLYRSESQPEQSYSERQLYEAALDRMAREIAAVEKLDERGAVQRITEVLAKSARGRRLAAEEAEIKAA